MENSRVALLGIIIENTDSVEKLNAIFHDYRAYMVGRMGIPYPKKGINIISVAMDAPNDIISSVSGKIGMLDGVSVKTVYAKA